MQRRNYGLSGTVFCVLLHDRPVAALVPRPKLRCWQASTPTRPSKRGYRLSLTIAAGAAPQGDPLEPILDAPDFPQPMYEALRDLSQDFLFPGLEQVPANTVTLLETNSTVCRIVPGRTECRNEQ